MAPRVLSLLAGSLSLALAVTALPGRATADPAPPTPYSDLARTADPPAGRVLDRAGMKQALQPIVRAGAVGVVAAVSDGTHPTVQGSAGWARLGDQRRAAGARDRFRAGSVTKMLTSVLALQLVDRGVWTMDTTIDDVSPTLWPEQGDVTIGQLLSHRSGLADFLAPLAATGTTEATFLDLIGKRRTQRSLLQVAQAQKPPFAPGTDYAYSNTNFLVAGMMVEIATHRGMRTLLRQRILDPVGMASSTYGTTPWIQSPSLREYARFPGDAPLDLGGFDPTMFAGAGALVTTTADLVRFHRALADGRLLTPASLELMRSPVSDVPEAGFVYGYGSFRVQGPCGEGDVLFGHDGTTFGTQTLTLGSPDGRRSIAIAMTGRDFGSDQKAYLAMYEAAFDLLATTCG